MKINLELNADKTEIQSNNIDNKTLIKLGIINFGIQQISNWKQIKTHNTIEICASSLKSTWNLKN